MEMNRGFDNSPAGPADLLSPVAHLVRPLIDNTPLFTQLLTSSHPCLTLW
jgi:hypothetical protein